MGNAFVYGTLMAPEVVELLISRKPVCKAATLHGYSRRRVKDRVYPAIIPAEPDSKVQGMVLLDLSAQELHILDGRLELRRPRTVGQAALLTPMVAGWPPAVYEAEEYYRTTVQPQLEDGSSVVADVYVWKQEYM